MSSDMDHVTVPFEQMTPEGAGAEPTPRRNYKKIAFAISGALAVACVVAVVVVAARGGSGSSGDSASPIMTDRALCGGDVDCPDTHTCVNYHRSIELSKGHCYPKSDGHCVTNSDCRDGKVCFMTTEDEHGECMHETSFLRGSEPITPQPLNGKAELPGFTNAIHTLADYSTPSCGQGICDNPATRDLYSSTKVTVDITVYLNLGSTDLQSKLDETIALTKTRYAGKGITLNFKKVNMQNNDLDGLYLSKSTTDSARASEGCILSGSQKNCIGAIDYANTLVPNWYNKQTFSVFVGPLIVPGLRGWAYFPWLGNVHGAVFVNSLSSASAVGSNAATMPHELGHGLGLWHTFHGQAEVSSCGSCSDYVGISDAKADIRGDFCADTLPMPRTWECSDPSQPDPCTGDAFKNTPHYNLMSYAPNECRRELTDQQAARAKCWILNAAKYFVDCRTQANSDGMKFTCS